jgi:choloylglycine hydrolase
MKSFFKKVVLGLISFIFIAQSAIACTSFQLIAADGSRVYARTMEFAFPLHSDLVVTPRKMQFVGTGPNNQKGLTWNAKYGAVGLNGFDQPVIIDGMNEKGMAGGILYFPGHAAYTNPANADPKKSLAPWEFLTWALTNFENVADLKASLKDVTIITVEEENLKVVPPFHYVLHDAAGGVLVIEPINGKLVASDDPYGVLTNSPPFDWHVNNLGNYVKLSPIEPAPIKVFGQTVSPISTGAGFLGMPGDSTAPSRFIRALAYTSTIVPAKNADENIRLAEHVLHNFDIPRGSIRSSAGENALIELTQWSTIGDLENRRFYFSTYDYQNLRMLDLKTINFDRQGVITVKVNQKLQAEKISLGVSN